MEALRKAAANSNQTRTEIIISLIAVIAVIFFFTIMLPDNEILNSSASVAITAGVPLAFAIVVIARQKLSGLYGKTHLALAIGLACWFAGEMIWTYDNMIVGREPTQLSLADVPWLTLYAFLGYYIFKTYRFFGYAVNRYHLFIVTSIVAGILAITSYSILSSPDLIRSSIVAAVRFSYPIGDAMLIVPSMLLLITLRRGLLTYTPWLFASIGLILIAAGDILFSNISLLDTIDIYHIVFPLYNAGNLTFAGALLWYNKFGIYDQSRAISSFQERNR